MKKKSCGLKKKTASAKWLLVFLLAFCLSLSSAKPASAGPEEGLFQAAKIIFDSAQQQDQIQRAQSYQQVRTILDTIVSDFPASDLAVRVILQDTIDGLSIAELDSFLQVTGQVEVPIPNAEADPNDAQSLVTTLNAQPVTSNYPVADEQTERALDLSRDQVRDLQARLLVSGYDPNGVDGAVGRGTRAAISSWQVSVSAEPSGYMNEELLSALKESSEQKLRDWLQVSSNARLHTPPPPIALSPRNMSGTWQYSIRCGSNSQTGTGSLTMNHEGGNRYSGRMRNSQGFVGRVSATLDGRTVRGTSNFGLFFGSVSFTARVDDQRLVMRGRDSNGCNFSSSK